MSKVYLSTFLFLEVFVTSKSVWNFSKWILGLVAAIIYSLMFGIYLEDFKTREATKSQQSNQASLVENIVGHFWRLHKNNPVDGDYDKP